LSEKIKKFLGFKPEEIELCNIDDIGVIIDTLIITGARTKEALKNDIPLNLLEKRKNIEESSRFDTAFGCALEKGLISEEGKEFGNPLYIVTSKALETFEITFTETKNE